MRQYANSYYRIDIICLYREKRFSLIHTSAARTACVRLSNHDHIVEADWEQLCTVLQRQSKDYEGDIEDLFQAEMYLFSPLTEPERFLNKEYFLTSQQKDIKRRILDKIRKVRVRLLLVQWSAGDR